MLIAEFLSDQIKSTDLTFQIQFICYLNHFLLFSNLNKNQFNNKY